MTKISISDIEKAAKLARIELSDKEKDQMTVEVRSILDFVDTLQKVDTKGVEETSQVTGLQDVWREDVPKKAEVNRDILLKGVPLVQDGFIKVKKVL